MDTFVTTSFVNVVPRVLQLQKSSDPFQLNFPVIRQGDA